MKELGAFDARLHREVGEKLKSAGIDRLFATGDLCRNTVEGFGSGATWFADTDELAADVRARLSNSVNVLVKGSRSMRMERVVDAVRAEA
jgi:UDP-N-acetylmuramoyl-tripeptide--D-alanyl-D-alanine ligase